MCVAQLPDLQVFPLNYALSILSCSFTASQDPSMLVQGLANMPEDTVLPSLTNLLQAVSL